VLDPDAPSSSHRTPIRSSDIVRLFSRCGRLFGLLALAVAWGTSAAGQLPVSRADAMRAALTSGTRFALARADTSAARGRLLTARVRPNPSLAAGYSKSVPRQHIEFEIPFDAPWSRRPRIRAAEALVRATSLRLLSERDAVLVEVDTTYTTALAAEAHFRLSQQTLRDADSVRVMTVRRRDEGDASDLDLDLATVVAGQQSNTVSNDSLTFASVMLTLQTLIGISADSVTIILADTLSAGPVGRELAPTPVAVMPAPALRPPSVIAAEASLRAAELMLTSERRNVFGLPALRIGMEYDDPSGDEPGILPLVGIVLPLPLFNRNRGAIAEAAAERDRARIELVAARLEVRQRYAEGRRERAALRIRVARDSDLVLRAQRVATRSLTAYREGASALPAVLEARRSAREVQSQYIDDLAALQIVEAELRALERVVPTP
jgi:cobalt-zinc-cadmium efflux system outer membrane protein